MISENLKKTIIGVIAGIVGVAVALGWFTPDQASEVNSQLTGLLQNIGALIMGAVSVWGIFTGGKDKKAEEK